MKNKRSLLAGIVVATLASFGWAGTLPLSSLDLKQLDQDFGEPKVDRSVEGNPLSIGGKKFEHGVGSHASSRLFIQVNGATRFTAVVGVDDDVAAKGSVRFLVIGDNKTLFDSGVLKGGGEGKPVDVSLAGVKELALVTAAPRGIDYCHADWADAKFEFDGAAPVAIAYPREAAIILTPPPPQQPRINGPKLFGVRPGHPILFRVPASGERPMSFKADNLPDGATFDENTGQLGGSVKTPGTYTIHLTASNAHGKAWRDLKLVVGDTLALTPLMGWNSWYGFADRVSDEKMRQAADMLVSTGLAEHGYSYVCIDDFWQQTPAKMAKDPSYGGPGRDAPGNIVPNPRFPDMKALTDHIHSLGLRAGIYSSPGPFTCGGALGSYDHEAADAKQYADWGFDLLKYDWCSYKPSLEDKRTTHFDPKTIAGFGEGAQKGQEKNVIPYALMGPLLKQQNRDIFHLMCQYGMGQSWNWAKEVNGQSARSTGDINDTWGSISGIGFGQYGKQGQSGPGYWSDPDMLQVGVIGLTKPHPTRLTPNEQYTQITLWSILPAPLLFGAHLDKLDDFTKSLLTNDEVIAVDQDSLGKQGRRVTTSDTGAEVWAKELEDGSTAVALFNRGEMEQTVTAKWADIGLAGKVAVRDLWRQKDVGLFEDQYAVSIPRHGAVFVRLSK